MSTDIRRLHAGRIRAERKARGWDKPEMARRLARAAGDTRGSLPDHDSLLTYVKRWERGTVGISERYRLLYCRAFDMAEEDLFASPQPILTEEPGTGDGLEVVEFIRRVEASDVGPSTMEGIQLGTHRLCREYPMKRPAELLPRICSYHHYVSRLLDGRATLAQRRELIVAGGTLSLLAACVHEDLGQRRAAELSGKTAQRAGMHTGHGELIAWAFEIRAWQALLDGRHRDAVEQCQSGLLNADATSSAAAQLVAQEARASARLGDEGRTRGALDRAAAIADRLGRQEWPGHHFVFDPRKLTSYTATTLAWLGDDSEEAERCARQVIRDEERMGRPRRVATARVDLAVILLARRETEEAAHLGRLAVTSGRLVPSNVWRVAELDRKLGAHNSRSPEITAFHEQFEQVRQTMHLMGHAVEGSR